MPASSLCFFFDQPRHVADRSLDFLGDAWGVVLGTFGPDRGSPSGEVEKILGEVLDILPDRRIRLWLDSQPELRPLTDVNLADCSSAGSRIQDDFSFQFRFIGSEKPGRFADGCGLADADAADECDLMLAEFEELGEPAKFLLVKLDLPDEDILEFRIFTYRLEIPERVVGRPERLSVRMIEIGTFEDISILFDEISKLPSLRRPDCLEQAPQIRRYCGPCPRTRCEKHSQD